MSSRPPKRRSARDATQQPIKRTRQSPSISPAPPTHSPTPEPANECLPPPPVRAMIFRGGQAYTPPVVTPLAPVCPAPIHMHSPFTESLEPHSALPLPVDASQEARSPPFPLQRALTNLQVVDRRVRLLLPQDASIVFPGATPPRAHTRSPPVIPEPDPSLWIEHYVSFA